MPNVSNLFIHEEDENFFSQEESEIVKTVCIISAETHSLRRPIPRFIVTLKLNYFY